MGSATSCTGKFDIVSEEEIKAAIQSIKEWEDNQKAGQKATQALRAVRKDSFKKAANELNQKGSIVERIGGPDRVHEVIQVFYKKLFANPETRQFFMNLPSDRMRAKQMKFMRYIVGGPITYKGNLRCVHAAMVADQGLDLAKFQLLEALLMETMGELLVPQDVVDDIASNIEVAKTAIFTPNADELVSSEEMTAAAEALEHPLVERLGGPHAVQAIIQAFYRKLFGSEELKYFFVSMNAERLRNMQFKFMRYLFAGPASYAQTGGIMRCVHARMVKEDGLDLPKFNMVVHMLIDVMEDLGVSKANMREVLANVEAAKAAIFTPTPDELVTREELIAEVAALMGEGQGASTTSGGDTEGKSGDDRCCNAGGSGSVGDSGGGGRHLVERFGGPEAVYDLIHKFYARLFNDEELKYFFALSAERLRVKQFKFMRYLLGGPPAYSGDLHCVHASLVRDRGLDGARFDRVVSLLTETLSEVAAPPDVAAAVMLNVEAARKAIFGSEGSESSRPASAVCASAAASGSGGREDTRPPSAARSPASATAARGASASKDSPATPHTTGRSGGSRPASALSAPGAGTLNGVPGGGADGTARRPASGNAPPSPPLGCPFARSLSHDDEAQLEQILAAVAASAAAMNGKTTATTAAISASGIGAAGVACSSDASGGGRGTAALAGSSGSSSRPGRLGVLGLDEEELLDAILEAPGVPAAEALQTAAKA